MRFFWAIFFHLLGLFWIHEAAKTMGPVGKLKVLSVYECDEKPQNDDVTLTAELKTIDGKGTKALSATIKNKIPIDNSVMYGLDVMKQEGGGWKSFYSHKGSLCTDAKKHIPKLYGKLRKQLKPAASDCPIKPGTYVLDKFQAETGDFPIPSIFYGRLKLKLNLSRNGKMMSCIQGEGDSQAPI